MSGQMPESDWRVLRDLKPIALERYCQRLLAEVEQIISSNEESHHERFLKLFHLIIERNKDLGYAFDDIRRSNSLIKLGAIHSRGLLTDAEFSRFTFETRESINQWLRGR
jgi:hypothetical protein